MAEEAIIMFPVSRLVQGSLYAWSDKDFKGNPIIAADGTPGKSWYFATAIAKDVNPHWAATDWGKIIWETGHRGYPNGQAQGRNFAWKIIDGDSVELSEGKNPKRWCDREGFKGHWVVKFNSRYPIRIVSADGTREITEPDMVKRGYFVQVWGLVKSDGHIEKPGIFLNVKAVAFSAYGEEIKGADVDTSTVGFSAVSLPAGASVIPVGGMTPGIGAPPAQSAPPVPPVPPAVTAAPPVTPNHQFVAGPGAAVAVPGAVAAPPAPPPPPVAPVRQMLPAANGATYEQLIAAGWTDALLVQHGMMAA